MNKKDIFTGIAIIFLGGSMMASSYFVGTAIKSTNTEASATIGVEESQNEEVMDISQAADYMNMTEDELQGIIITESDILQKTSTFSGKMLPYFTIDNKKYFYKEELNEWLKEVSSQQRKYNLKEGWIL